MIDRPCARKPTRERGFLTRSTVGTLRATGEAKRLERGVSYRSSHCRTRRTPSAATQRHQGLVGGDLRLILATILDVVRPQKNVGKLLVSHVSYHAE